MRVLRTPPVSSGKAAADEIRTRNIPPAEKTRIESNIAFYA